MSDGQEATSPRGAKKDTKNGKESKTQDYADAWGIRKLISHCLRNLRLDRIPRVTWCFDYHFSDFSAQFNPNKSLWIKDYRSLIHIGHTKAVPWAKTPATRKLMKIFLDAWYPGSWAQLQLQPAQSADVENGENDQDMK